MKNVDAAAIGLLVGAALESEIAYPVADRELGYSEDYIGTLKNVGGDLAHIEVVTQGGARFRIVVTAVD